VAQTRLQVGCLWLLCELFEVGYDVRYDGGVSMSDVIRPTVQASSVTVHISQFTNVTLSIIVWDRSIGLHYITL
jgi:hypothetical protein